MRYPAVLLDLFRTVVLYRPGTATNKIHQPDWRAAMLRLGPRLREVADLDVEAFLDALVAATDAIAAERGAQLREVPIETRYQRALGILGFGGDAARAARGLAAVQVEAQMDGTVVPDSHRAALATLASRRKLALVSNFDHAPSLRAMLARHDIDRYFSAIVISVEHGRRKPHPSVFAAALDALGAAPGDALHAGDSFGADVRGAQASGIDVAWINPADKPLPDGAAPPTYQIRSLADLAGILDSDVHSERNA